MQYTIIEVAQRIFEVKSIDELQEQLGGAQKHRMWHSCHAQCETTFFSKHCNDCMPILRPNLFLRLPSQTCTMKVCSKKILSHSGRITVFHKKEGKEQAPVVCCYCSPIYEMLLKTRDSIFLLSKI